MAKYAVIILLCLFIPCHVTVKKPVIRRVFTINIDRLADAIYVAEGGKRYAYGINRRYVKYRSLSHARAICLRTIKHAIKDYKHGDFYVFLGSRYCPPNAHKLNRNWVNNVKRIYAKNN